MPWPWQCRGATQCDDHHVSIIIVRALIPNGVSFASGLSRRICFHVPVAPRPIAAIAACRPPAVGSPLLLPPLNAPGRRLPRADEGTRRHPKAINFALRPERKGVHLLIHREGKGCTTRGCTYLTLQASKPRRQRGSSILSSNKNHRVIRREEGGSRPQSVEEFLSRRLDAAHTAP